MWGRGDVLPRNRSLSGDKACREGFLPWLLLCVFNCLVYLYYIFICRLSMYWTLSPAPLHFHLCTVTCLGHPTPFPSLRHSPLCSLCSSQPPSSRPGSCLPFQTQDSVCSLLRAPSLSVPHFSYSAGMLPICTLRSCQFELCMSDSHPSLLWIKSWFVELGEGEKQGEVESFLRWLF